MNRYLNQRNGTQLFDGDGLSGVLDTVSQTAQDIERIYHRFDGSSSDDGSDTGTDSGSSNDAAQYVVAKDATTNTGTDGDSKTGTDYLPIVIVSGLALIIIAIALR
ncbi:MAG: hypothetical protein ABI876_14150 [Bacteroidota bacterium]